MHTHEAGRPNGARVGTARRVRERPRAGNVALTSRTRGTVTKARLEPRYPDPGHMGARVRMIAEKT